MCFDQKKKEIVLASLCSSSMLCVSIFIFVFIHIDFYHEKININIKDDMSNNVQQQRKKSSHPNRRLSGDATPSLHGGAAAKHVRHDSFDDTIKHILTTPITCKQDLQEILGLISSLSDENQRKKTLGALELRLNKVLLRQLQFEHRLTVDEKQLLSQFQCSICLYLFKDPVLATDGYTYCRSCITNWFSRSKQSRSPMTNIPLTSRQIIPNIQCKTTLNHLITMFHQKYSSL